MVAPMLTVGSAWLPVAPFAQVARGRPLRLPPAAVVFGVARE
jgi:hypothetical protein